jgi:hypothetical protein
VLLSKNPKAIAFDMGVGQAGCSPQAAATHFSKKKKPTLESRLLGLS